MKGLRRMRKAAGITQEEIGERLGVVKATVSAWERCVTTPSINIAFRIAEILGCSVEDLYYDDSTPEKEETP